MIRSLSKRRWLLLFLLFFVGISSSASTSTDGTRPSKRRLLPKANNRSATSVNVDPMVVEDDIPRVHFLVEFIGKELYAAVKKPKYKFYIYMTIGALPNEKNTIVFLSTICNILYGLSVLFGFLFFARGPMLFVTVATLWIGPALVLILLGLIGAVLAVFAFYPLRSVAAMCVWFFATSKMAQTLGKRWGLDSDGDGDVDWLDLLHFVASTDIGQSIGLMRLHEILNSANQDPFQELHHRLNVIDQNTQEIKSIRTVGSDTIVNGAADKPKSN